MEINIKRQMTPFEWLQLPTEAKNLFKEIFKIPRSAGTIVIGDQVISDGHTNEDLSRVSLLSLQEYLKTIDDHWDNLLKLTINKMERTKNGEVDEFSGKISGKVASIGGVGLEPRPTGKTSRTKKAKKTN